MTYDHEGFWEWDALTVLLSSWLWCFLPFAAQSLFLVLSPNIMHNFGYFPAPSTYYLLLILLIQNWGHTPIYLFLTLAVMCTYKCLNWAADTLPTCFISVTQISSVPVVAFTFTSHTMNQPAVAAFRSFLVSHHFLQSDVEHIPNLIFKVLNYSPPSCASFNKANCCLKNFPYPVTITESSGSVNINGFSLRTFFPALHHDSSNSSLSFSNFKSVSCTSLFWNIQQSSSTTIFNPLKLITLSYSESSNQTDLRSMFLPNTHSRLQRFQWKSMGISFQRFPSTLQFASPIETHFLIPVWMSHNLKSLALHNFSNYTMKYYDLHSFILSKPLWKPHKYSCF